MRCVVSEGVRALEPLKLMTVKQLAEKHGVSYEAMRKLLSKHADALKGHIITQDRTRYVDEWGVKFLEDERMKSRIVVIREDHTDEIARLTEEVEQLKAQLMAAQGELVKAQDERLKAQSRIIELQDAHLDALAMRDDLDRKEQELDGIRREAAEQKAEDAAVISRLLQERDAAKAEADSYQRSWFGFYRKR